MKCFLCKRTGEEVLLLNLPVDMFYKNLHMEFLGNCEEDEFMCLPCIGYTYDEVAKQTEGI